MYVIKSVAYSYKPVTLNSEAIVSRMAPPIEGAFCVILGLYVLVSRKPINANFPGMLCVI